MKSSPSGLVTVQLYSPWSVYCTSWISKTEEVAHELILYLKSSEAIISSSFLHTTDGSGVPLKAQLTEKFS